MDGIDNSSEEDDDNYDGYKIFCILYFCILQYSDLCSTSMIIPSISERNFMLPVSCRKSSFNKAYDMISV